MKNTKNSKRHSFLAIALVTAILLSFIACEDDDSDLLSISLDKDTLKFIIKEGEQQSGTLLATVKNTSNKEVTWTSSEPKVAYVRTDDNGYAILDGEGYAMVIALDYYGTTTITAKMVDGGKEATCEVTVQLVETNDKGIEMIWIPGGTFIMGQTGVADPTHSVTMTEFCMSRHEVTQEQYLAMMAAPSLLSNALGKDDNFPVYGVTWYDAVEFCNKLNESPSDNVYMISGTDVTADFTKNGYRLPTEQEWEYACRAGTTTMYNTGDTIVKETGWYKKYSDKMTHEVGKIPANAWGLFDMHGNVSEWCWDWYADYPSSVSGPTDGFRRVTRGGSWDDTPEVLRSAFRSPYLPDSKLPFIGFRVVRRAEHPAPPPPPPSGP